jgi:hypothetical protein
VIRERTLAAVGAALVAVSTAFPIAASLSRIEGSPTWIGVLDVSVAGALMIGLAWRAWVVRYVLPAWLSLWRAGERS